MKNKIFIPLVIFIGTLTFICCAPNPEKQVVHEVFLHQHALNNTSSTLQKKWKNVKNEMQELKCDSILEANQKMPQLSKGKVPNNKKTVSTDSIQKIDDNVVQRCKYLNEVLDSLRIQMEINQHRTKIVEKEIKGLGGIEPNDPGEPCPPEAECGNFDAILANAGFTDFNVTYLIDGKEKDAILKSTEFSENPEFVKYNLDQDITGDFQIKIEYKSDQFDKKIEYQIKMPLD